MKRVIFAGTSEGRILCEQLSQAGIQATVCVATEYGKAVLPEMQGITVHTGRMAIDEMISFLKNTEIVVDATHPYAVEASQNIRQACQAVHCQYIRLLRPKTQAENVIHTVSAEQAAAYLVNTQGNILLTVGSKELNCFTSIPDYEKRLWIRVLPAVKSIETCKNQGFLSAHIIMMQGPFSEELNIALLHMSEAKWLVTKDTGTAGGLPEKLSAAKKCGCQVVMIDRPQEEGMPPEQVRDFFIPPKIPRFPLFIDLTGRKCLVVGCGKVGARRAKVLLRYGAEVTVVAPEGTVPEGVIYKKRVFVPEDVNNMFIVTAATNNRAVNHEIYTICRQKDIFVSTADNQAESTFFFPAVRTGKNVSVGLVSDGSSHKKTAQIACAIEKVLQEGDI